MKQSVYGKQIQGLSLRVVYNLQLRFPCGNFMLSAKKQDFSLLLPQGLKLRVICNSKTRTINTLWCTKQDYISIKGYVKYQISKTNEPLADNILIVDVHVIYCTVFVKQK